MIYSFKRLVYKKGFFPGNPLPILLIGWPLVWIMWIVVTIVYAEVIIGIFFFLFFFFHRETIIDSISNNSFP